MKFINSFFKPYAEYCIRTTFSGEDLNDVFQKEFPSCYNTFAWIRSAFPGEKPKFFRSCKPFVLIPVLGGRNTQRGEVVIKCQKDEQSTETILHITIMPQDTRLFIWLMFCFYAGFGVLIFCSSKPWFCLIPLLLMPALLFMVLAVCRSAAESEVPKIKQAFETTLRNLEQKYRRNEQ